MWPPWWTGPGSSPVRPPGREPRRIRTSASLSSMAFLFATRAARRASNVALHVHGGYGFTLEYDIQLYYRRAQSWPLALG